MIVDVHIKESSNDETWIFYPITGKAKRILVKPFKCYNPQAHIDDMLHDGLAIMWTHNHEKLTETWVLVPKA